MAQQKMSRRYTSKNMTRYAKTRYLKNDETDIALKNIYFFITIHKKGLF